MATEVARCEGHCLDALAHMAPRKMGNATVVSRPKRHARAHARDSPTETPSLVLLGVLSGSRTRRDLIRCTWLTVKPPGVRALFIVGRNQTDAAQPDVVTVRVTEGERMRSYKQKQTSTFSGIVTGSVSTYWKLIEYLRFAAAQPEPIIARADDDVFIQPRMLATYAQAFVDSGAPLIFAGAFEWYSWRTRTLHSTGFGLSAGESRWRRGKTWRNCTSASESPWHLASDYGESNRTLQLASGGAALDPCIGPVAFAKGPLMLVTRMAVQRVLASKVFARDVVMAHAMSEGRVPAYEGPGSGRIDDDVQLGYWLSQVEDLRMVTLRRYASWHDRWKPGVYHELRRLLMAHKVPWDQYAVMVRDTEKLWRAGRAQLRTRCSGMPCSDCAHLPTQEACVTDVELLVDASKIPSTCLPKCSFVRGVEPAVPAQCSRLSRTQHAQ